MFRALSSFEGTVGGLVVSVVAGTLLVFLLKKTGKQEAGHDRRLSPCPMLIAPDVRTGRTHNF